MSTSLGEVRARAPVYAGPPDTPPLPPQPIDPEITPTSGLTPPLSHPRTGPIDVARTLGEVIDEATRAQTPDSGDGHESSTSRSGLAIAGVAAMAVAGTGRQLFDAARVAVFLPEAWNTGGRDLVRAIAGVGEIGVRDAYRAGGAQFLTVVRQMITAAPTTNVVDPASAVFKASRFSQWAYPVSVSAGAALAGVQILAAVPNIMDGLNQDGVAGLANSRSGRTGVINAVAGGLTIAAVVGASIGPWQVGTRGFDLLRAALSSRMVQAPWLAGIGFLSAGLVIANEVGLLDGLNRRPQP